MYYLALQNTYQEVQIALMEGNATLASTSLSKMNASKELITKINELLAEKQKTIQDLSFIAANCGPGPFTTLRVVITTVDGIAYATQTPLIGINALEAAAREWKDEEYMTTAILFNAFGNDVYTSITHNEKEYLYGVFPIETILERLHNIEGRIRFLGNGALLHQAAIMKKLGEKALFPDTTAEYCSLQSIAQIGLEKYNDGKTEPFLLPVYMKQHPAAS
jgi:tRNA threonylcarbamoyladenosine biosynthesis protein TsaB